MTANFSSSGHNRNPHDIKTKNSAPLRSSRMAPQIQPNDLWSLYAQTVVRGVYYASEKRSESFELINFERDIARQQKILHPEAIKSTPLKMFTPVKNSRFCEFHDSPLYNPVQIDLWRRIYIAINSALSLHDIVDISYPTGKWPFKHCLEDMSKVLNTNHIPLVEPEDFEAEANEPLPVDTPCPGCHITWFCSDFFWCNIRTIMAAAILFQDDHLLSWLQIVAEIRYNTKLCDEFRAILPCEDLFQFRDPTHLQHEAHKHAIMIATDIKSRMKVGVRYGSLKI